RPRPGVGLPVAQRVEVHCDKQGCEQAAGRHGIHHDRQQRNPDDGEAASESALQETDQKDAGEGNQDGHDRQLWRDRGGGHSFLARLWAVIRPEAAASISERAIPMSFSASSSNSQSLKIAARRAKWRRSLSIGRKVFENIADISVLHWLIHGN